MLLMYQASFTISTDSNDGFTSIQGVNVMSNGEMEFITSVQDVICSQTLSFGFPRDVADVSS